MSFLVPKAAKNRLKVTPGGGRFHGLPVGVKGRKNLLSNPLDFPINAGKCTGLVLG
jgi:hypothetical protein